MAGGTLGPFRLAEELGSGGMGRVWRAVGPHGVVALKLVHPHLLETPGARERFLREGEIGRSIRHPNVVATLDVGEEDGALWLAMEFVEGQTLRSLLAELGLVPEELCRHVGREVAKGLAAIHAAGAVHRDVKPENVLVTREHVVKLMDLGVARRLDETTRLSRTGAFVGSVEYAAPEQFKDGDLDGRADLHALGLVLYEAATNVNPYRADEIAQVFAKVLNETPRRAGELNPQLSPFFEETLARLLAKKREDRFASADELVRVLDAGERSTWWRTRAVELRAATRKPLRRIRIPRETALVGRDDDVAKLRALFESAKAGDGRVVLVEGEAGIGKSRLVDELVGLLQSQGEDVNFLFGGWPPGGAATASGAVSTALREHFGDEGLDAALRDALPQTPLLVPAFAALLRGDAAPAGSEPLTKDSLQTVFVHATRSLAGGRPTILLIDDLHFAPEEGRALFAALALSVPGHRILLVGTARPALDERWTAQIARLPQTTRLAVSRLGPRDLVALLRDALGSEHLAEELGGRIAEKTDGNPYFVFEVLRGLREGRYLTQRADGTWATTRILRDVRIPATVRELVQARLLDLSDDERALLEAAACIGFEFDPGLAGDVLGMGRIPLLKTLGRIEKVHRLVRSAGPRFAFDHHQVQEHLYEGLSDFHRREYHAAVGEALEARSGAASKPTAELDGALCVDLAEHFLKGGLGARALRHLDPALTHLERGYLNDAAIRLAGRALAAPGLVSGAERVDVLLRMAGRLDLLGRRDGQRAALDEALALADARGDAARRARALTALGGMLWRTSRCEEARPALDEALTIARAAGDAKTEALATGILGNVFQSLGRLAEAREQDERHLALARADGDRRAECGAMVNLGVVLIMLGRLEEARDCCRRTLALAAEIGDRDSACSATGNLGVVLRMLGHIDEGREHAERQLALAREIGDRQDEANATCNVGNVFKSQDRLAKALEQYERHLELAREIGDGRGEALATGNLASVLHELGRLDDARRHFERVLVLERQIGDRWNEANDLDALAGLSEEQGDAAAAERGYAEALALRRALGHRAGEAETLAARGAFLARQGRHGQARADFAGAVAIAEATSLPAVVLAGKARLAALPGGDAAPALAALEAGGGAAPMDVRFLLWQSTRDPSHLVEAKRLLDFLVEHAPQDCRGSMLANVRLHREIAAAAATLGDPPPAA